MTDSTLNRFISSGTNAERLAFTPNPPTPASGPDVMYIWLETDTDDFYGWDPTGAVWVQLNVPGTPASTTEVLTGTDTSKYVTPDALAALWEQGSDIASAATISVGEGGYFHVTGTTTITDIDFGTTKAGRAAKLVFDGILTLTHNATTLILPTGANITTAAGDTCLVVSEGGDNVRVTDYMRKDGTALVGGAGGGALELISEVVTSASQADVTFSSIATTWRDLEIVVRARGTGAATQVNLRVQFNGDTGANYSWSLLAGSGSAAASGSASGLTSIERLVDFPGASATANAAGTAHLIIGDYRGTTFFKNVVATVGARQATDKSGVGVGEWASTAAINAVKLFWNTGNFVDNSVVSLYGRM